MPPARPTRSTRIGELERAIAEAPDDDALKTVYADALQDAGDKRGEHIALALAGEAKSRAIERALERRFAKSFPDHVLRLRWRAGFVEHVELGARAVMQLRELDRECAGPLRTLLGRRELIALRGLDVRSASTANAAIERIPALVADLPVRWVGIGPLDLAPAHVHALFAALPRLDGVAFTTRADPLPAADALRDIERLRDVDFGMWGTERRPAVVERMLALTPALERLVVRGLDSAGELAEVLDGTRYPKLRHLGAMGDLEPTYALLRALVGSPLLPRLASLGFRAAAVYDDDTARAFVQANAAAFAHVSLFASGAWAGEDRGHEAGRLALVLRALGRHGEAVPELVTHLEHSGTVAVHAGCWASLGDSLLYDDRPEEALEPLARSAELYGAGNENAAWTLRLLARAQRDLRRYAECAKTCEAAIAVDPRSAFIWQIYGVALRELDRNTEAIAAFGKAIGHAARIPAQRDMLAWALELRGHLRFGLRQLPRAVADFERAIADTTGDREPRAEAWQDLGHVARYRGDDARARDCFAQAAELAVDDGEPLDLLGATLYELGDPAGALAAWDRAIAEHGWIAADERAHALLALNRIDDALAVTTTLSGRALALHAAGRTDDAVAALDNYAGREEGEHTPCIARAVEGPMLVAMMRRTVPPRPKSRELDALYAELVRRHKRPKPACHSNCTRRAAVAAIVCALAAGDRADAEARARVLAKAVERELATLSQQRLWETRAAAVWLSPDDTTLALACASLVERCAGDLPLARPRARKRRT